MATLAETRSLIAEAEHVIILAGAGMSAEVGIPTYWSGPEARYGDQRSTYGYTDIEHAHAILWQTDPGMQSAFFANKITHFNSLDPMAPGSAYASLLPYLQARSHMVATSNPDNFFHRAGVSLDSLFEVHGSYRNSQCLNFTEEHGILPTLIEKGLLLCRECGGIARPNVLFFEDFEMLEDIYLRQREAFYAFLEECDSANTVVLEIGAGSTVPTIRNMSMRLNHTYELPVVRINPHVETGVDGAAWAYQLGKNSPFIHVRKPVTQALGLLLPPE